MQIPRTPGLKEFTVADLKTATNNFSPDTLIGLGGFWKVFIGWVDEKTLAPSKSKIGMAVTIKISEICVRDSPRFEQWQSEINFLGRHYHPNVIVLLGYCWEKKTLALVYEFMQNGSLGDHLYGSCSMKPLSWNIRFKIAIEVARGLAFLHTLEKKVIHRDFKTSNILLDQCTHRIGYYLNNGGQLFSLKGDDDLQTKLPAKMCFNYNVKLSNFGLAVRGPRHEELPIPISMLRIGPSDIYHSTQQEAIIGYFAPEYSGKGDVYIKSDVYSFGVVLLELLTGLKSIDITRPDEEQHLVAWLVPKLSNKTNLETIIDVRMEGQYSTEAAFQAAELTKKCLDMNPESRPSMKEVVEELKHEVNADRVSNIEKMPDVEKSRKDGLEELAGLSSFDVKDGSLKPKHHHQRLARINPGVMTLGEQSVMNFVAPDPVPE